MLIPVEHKLPVHGYNSPPLIGWPHEIVINLRLQFTIWIHWPKVHSRVLSCASAEKELNNVPAVRVYGDRRKPRQ